MRIGDRQVGPGNEPYIIAELGVNHDGSVEKALELVREAQAAGADAIKLQLFRTDLLMSSAAKLAAYQKAAGETDPISMLRRLELSPEQMQPVLAEARCIGIDAIVTVFSVELVAEAERIARPHGGWDAYKTASPDIIHRPLLEALAATGRPMIVSTGASTMDEVTRAAEWLRTPRQEQRLAMLQCVSSYPTPRAFAAIGAINTLRQTFRDITIGYSDHTAAIEMGGLAVAKGACILEKHFTYDRAAHGPDHSASLDFQSFSQYVAHVRKFGRDRVVDLRASPDDPKIVQDRERDVRTVSRQSVVSRRALPVGYRLTREDLTFKRPGTGVPPFAVDEVVGSVLVRAVGADMPIMWTDIGREQPREEGGE